MQFRAPAASLPRAAAARRLARRAITGTVTYDGKVPNLKPIAMAADPMCAKKHTNPVPNEALVLGTGNTMANVLVRVKSGLPAGKTYPARPTPVVIDQNGCQLQCRTWSALMVGQPFKVLNSDGLLHNVHALPKVNKPFNMAMPANRTEADTKFDKAEGMFLVKCDVHPWMNAYVGVFSHPVLRGDRHGRQVHDRRPARRDLRARGLAREARHPDGVGDGRRERQQDGRLQVHARPPASSRRAQSSRHQEGTRWPHDHSAAPRTARRTTHHARTSWASGASTSSRPTTR